VSTMKIAIALLLVSLIMLSGCAEPQAAASKPIQQPSQEAPQAEDASEAIDVVSSDEVDIGELY